MNYTNSILSGKQQASFLTSPSDKEKRKIWQFQSYNIVDLLKTAPSAHSLSERVHRLGLSAQLQEKIDRENTLLSAPHEPKQSNHLSKNDEKEMASEVLLYRHKFTCLVFENRVFRQAALSIIQNIYLFQQRKIFFSTTHSSAEQERQHALLLFSQSSQNNSIPLAKTFQHLVLARIWDRIVTQADDSFLQTKAFLELHDVVENLNTLRNVYMLLSMGLVRKLTSNISKVYKQSITREDAHQIGLFGIARAAYRYHPSSGLRYSTYAAFWIQKEIQRQALDNRLIRISSNLIEQISRAIRLHDSEEERSKSHLLSIATAQLTLEPENSPLANMSSPLAEPAEQHEKEEIHSLLLQAIDEVLSEKSRDVILRRYGLGKYKGREQSVIEIAKVYGVTRGSIYQLEQSAMGKLKKQLSLIC